jgi:hypothetical protein
VDDLIDQPLGNEPEPGVTGGYYDPVATAEYKAWSKSSRGRLTILWPTWKSNLRNRLYHLRRPFGRQDRYDDCGC